MTPPSHQMPPIMSDAPCHDGGIIYHCKTHLNIDIYPCMLYFLKILSISMILRGVEWSLVGVPRVRGGGLALRKQTFSTK